MKNKKFTVDLPRVYELSRSKAGELPKQINCLIIAEGAFPGWSVMRGRSFGRIYPMAIPSFQVMYHEHSIIIDVPFNEALFRKFKIGTRFHRQQYDVMQYALVTAEKIVVTHEHWDHVGGIAKSVHLERITPKILLSQRQIQSHHLRASEFSQDFLNQYVPLQYEDYYGLAPGMVLINAPGHTVGSQIIFVELQNGAQYFFIGDIVWSRDNITHVRSRPFVVSKLFLREQMKSLNQQIQWMHDHLDHREQEQIYIVISHDMQGLQALIDDGKLGSDFA